MTIDSTKILRFGREEYTTQAKIDALRAGLAADIEKFLAKGGKIETVPSGFSHYNKYALNKTGENK